MGTNFYLQHECKCCGHVAELHIGKSAGGWAFTFQGHEAPPIKSWKDWQDHIASHKDWKIVSDGGSEIAPAQFAEMVEKSRAGDNHLDYIKGDRHWAERARRRIEEGEEWKDEDGWAFCLSNFS